MIYCMFLVTWWNIRYHIVAWQNIAWLRYWQIKENKINKANRETKYPLFKYIYSIGIAPIIWLATHTFHNIWCFMSLTGIYMDTSILFSDPETYVFFTLLIVNTIYSSQNEFQTRCITTMLSKGMCVLGLKMCWNGICQYLSAACSFILQNKLI